MKRRTFEDLILALDELTPENARDNVVLIREGLRDLGRRFLVVEAMSGSDHRPPRKSAITKEQRS
jgi:hypothetical protein